MGCGYQGWENPGVFQRVKMTEVGEGGRFCVVIGCGGTMSLLSTGTTQDRVGVGASALAGPECGLDNNKR